MNGVADRIAEKVTAALKPAAAPQQAQGVTAEEVKALVADSIKAALAPKTEEKKSGWGIW